MPNNMNTKIEEREPEIWVDVTEYEGKYRISSHGEVESVNYNQKGFPKKLVKRIDKDGYLCVVFSRNCVLQNFKVHRLVGGHFIDNPLNLPEINHKYGDKKNNYYKDLEWSTRRDNSIHALLTGLRPYTTEKQRVAIIATNTLKRKQVYQYSLNKEFIKKYLGLKSAQEDTGIDGSNISSCCLSKVKTAGGFIWSYTKL